MKTRKKKGTRLISLLLTLILLAGVLSCGSFNFVTYADGGPVGDVIFNQPSQWAPGSAIETISWSTTAISHLYDIAYTPEASLAYNGYATDAHLVMRDNTISIYGYQTYARMDYLFTDVYKLDSLAFTLTPSNMNFHSFSETGFLFNGNMSMIGGTQYYTGYAITLTCENPAGMMENTGTAANTATLRIYYIDGEEWNTLSFQPGSVATTRTLVATVKSGIKTLDSTPYRVSIDLDHATKAFKVYVDGVLRADVPGSMVPAGAGHGFGFYMGSYAHNCGILSRVSYEYVMASVEPLPDPTHSTVNFIFRDGGTDTVIRAPEKVDGLPGNRYRIEPPRVIMYEGIKYVLTGSDRGAEAKTGITLVYRPDSDNNITNLYYTKATVIVTEGAPPPEKEAWVNGDSDITSVRVGDEIEYAITAYATPAPPPAMLAVGNDGNQNSTNWWTAPVVSHGVRKGDIRYISFLNLTPAEFSEAEVGEWDGSPTGPFWNASAEGNSDVRAWVLGGDHLYVGAVGGVYLSDGANQFNNFINLESIDFEYLYTDNVTDMNNMFENCGSLEELDLSGFDTSKVTDMHYMFESCGSLETLNISSFDTSEVTDMHYMFGWCKSLETLNVRSFSTSKVEKFNSMFEECDSLTVLDLRNFDTSSADDMSCMFTGCTNLENLDLTSFNTSGVTNMTDMFCECESLKYLDLLSFDTSSVTSAYGMFSGCSSLISTKDKPFQVNHFSVTNIRQLWMMFSWCEAFEYLDLCQWEIVAADATNMFEHCENLAEIHLESVDFTDSTTDFDDMFEGTFVDIKIFVSVASAGWIGTNEADLGLTHDSYSLITPANDLNDEWHDDCNAQPQAPATPVSWELGYVPPTRPVPKGYVIITDIIPDGLAIDEDSITGSKTASFIGTETSLVWKISSQEITWQIPASMLPVTLSVKAIVAASPIGGDVYENTADVTYNDETQTTNIVSHTFVSDYFLVREEYYLYNSAPTDVKIAEDYEARGTGGSYRVRGLESPLKEIYILMGYAVDGGVFVSSGALPADGDYRIVKLYYKTLTVTVYFVDQGGIALRTPSIETVVPGKDFFIPNRYFDSIGANAYYAYKGTAPSDGTHPAPGGSPVYPGSPALSGVNTDMQITLYFTASQSVVTVRFAELGNPSHILRGDETFFFSVSFVPPNTLRDDITVEDLDEQVYHYANSYSTDGAGSSGFPGTQTTSGHLITLYFETEYPITEMFHSETGRNPVTVLSPDISTSFPGGGLFTGNPPATIDYGGYKWTYKGFKIGNDEALLDPGDTVSFVVMEEITIIYVYERGNGPGNTGNTGGYGGGDTTGDKESPSPTVPPTEKPDITPPGETTPEEPDIDGNDSSTPPPLHDVDNTLVQQEGNVYIEYDRNGTPLGQWHWDDELEEWVFDEYPPDAGLPQTGDTGMPVSMLFILLDLSLIASVFTIVKLVSLRRGKMQS